jgi:hypothetical protein
LKNGQYDKTEVLGQIDEQLGNPSRACGSWRTWHTSPTEQVQKRVRDAEFLSWLQGVMAKQSKNFKSTPGRK